MFNNQARPAPIIAHQPQTDSFDSNRHSRLSVKNLQQFNMPIAPSTDKSANPAGHSILINMKDLSRGIFSDLTITCQGEEFEVHKAVLYIQSKYFRKLLGGNFKVRQQQLIPYPV